MLDSLQDCQPSEQQSALLAHLPVWMQVARAGLALALAPIVDGCLLMVQCRLGLRSRSASFWLVAGVMLSLAALIFGTIVAIWS